LVSFGYKYGLPPTFDLALDCRFPAEPVLRRRAEGPDGTETAVAEYVSA